MALLMAKLLVIAQEQRAAEIADIRGDIVEAAWGNQIRNYVFHPYKLVKDVRTGQVSWNHGPFGAPWPTRAHRLRFTSAVFLEW